MTVEIEQEDLEVLCECALRYCHGRRTYMPSLVQEIVQRHFDDLSDERLKSIRADSGFQAGLDLWGDDCDKQDWLNFYEAIDRYRQKKGASNELVE